MESVRDVSTGGIRRHIFTSMVATTQAGQRGAAIQAGPAIKQL
jgi:hypothetical protein